MTSVPLFPRRHCVVLWGGLPAAVFSPTPYWSSAGESLLYIDTGNSRESESLHIILVDYMHFAVSTVFPSMFLPVDTLWLLLWRDMALFKEVMNPQRTRTTVQHSRLIELNYDQHEALNYAGCGGLKTQQTTKLCPFIECHWTNLGTYICGCWEHL